MAPNVRLERETEITIFIEAFVYWVQDSLVTMLLNMLMWVWYLALYIFSYAALVIIFVKVGRGIRIALLMDTVTFVYDMITS